ncbi:type II toxin-antitoxin system RelE/ParE family toxin [Novosphingobium sp. Fuku2-ISO-50]|uniref:type II toxin-antitoxin system RelE/ParE family toxin n=1 Tax=Novosphingobium sp. Fuku2-ISO-50 TaxID=1739114 RepID=UPI00076D8320|nr:type II toxin-antitoxin system RelE/ParE family toxin [Novosphingobium sp. Fuku2-ISO-50]KUR80342.1 plasmid stabilization protein [Novosphingobium sp. Fuku2-ISO-50]
MSDVHYAVELTAGATRELEDIVDHLAALRGADDAAVLLDAFLESIATLERFALRGAVPQELDALGIREFRQILLGHFRLIYRVIGERVVILIIADGRRDMRALLERRLLGQ